MERAYRTLREALEGQELSDRPQSEPVLKHVVGWYNHQRLHRALGYLRPVDYYRGDRTKFRVRLGVLMHEEDRWWPVGSTTREIRERLYPGGTPSDHATVQKLLQRFFPERQLIVRSGERMRTLRLSTNRQAVLVTVGIMLGTWTLLSSSLANSTHIPGLLRGHDGTIMMVEHGRFEGRTDYITVTPERHAMEVERDAADVCFAFLLERRLYELGWDHVWDGEVVGVVAGGHLLQRGAVHLAGRGEQGGNASGHESLLPVPIGNGEESTLMRAFPAAPQRAGGANRRGPVRCQSARGPRTTSMRPRAG